LRAVGCDAVAAPGGVPQALGTTHDVPSRDDCERCHGWVSDVLIGVSAIQLSAADGKGALSQLAAAGRLSDPPAAEFAPPGSGVVQDALGYLHGNCGHCHNEGVPFTRFVPLLMRLRVGDATPADTDTYKTAIRHRAQHQYAADVVFDVVPGAPDQSQLYVRMGLRDLWAMPPVCTAMPNPTGMATIHDWIAALPP
jgi:hypothetical protein